MTRARILSPTPENIAACADELRRGEIGGMPTETVYGLAGDGLNPLALTRVFDAKERPKFDPLILHVSPGLLRAGKYEKIQALENLGLVEASAIPSEARQAIEKLMDTFWPGPLTLVLPKLASVPDLATSGLPSVALRMPRHPVALALIDATQRPLAAPSANRFGRISPTRARHVVEELGERIGWVLDGGPCEIGVESTVVSYDPSGDFTLLRPGGLGAAEIEAILKVRLKTVNAPVIGPAGGPAGGPAASPGLLESHYAPAKPLRLLSAPLSALTDEQLKKEFQLAEPASDSRPWGFLAFAGDSQNISKRLSILAGRPVVVRTLSRDGSMMDAARSLFSELRALDASSAEYLWAEPPSDAVSTGGIGYAIQDRLKRASAKRR
ncbi:MAG: L-threonylcarbamoyladenylate synthase [Oligoflexia bacterium]|nr:L-threonylcarbamoyladenylate synthase [Oligoflexia bacterium]